MRGILKKIFSVSLTLLGVSLLAFVLLRLIPGDPVMLMLGERGASPEVYAQMQAELGLDKPIHEQYAQYMGRLFQGDLGRSIVSQRPVIEEFSERFPATLELGLVALFFAIIIGIPMGVGAALGRGKVMDYLFSSVALIGYSMPIFWWGLLLILFFSIQLNLTPVSGRLSIIYDIEPITGFLLLDSLLSEDGGSEVFWDAFRHILLPAIAMGTIPLAVITRMTRAAMLEILGNPFIKAATAKGLPRWRVVFLHGLRNALIPIITVVGLMFGTIVTGAILTETIFSWPGIGKWLVRSVTSRDYPVIQGGILLIATFIIAINLTVDLANRMADPKARSES